MNRMDEGKPSTVALYIFEVEIDGLRYSGQIPARDAQEALAASIKLGGVLTGRLTDEIKDGICSLCRGEFQIENKEHPEGKQDDWPDDIG